MSLRRAENLLKLDAIAAVDNIAKLDYNRYLRRGIPEIVYAQNKTTDQLSSIVSRLVTKKLQSSNRMPVILSRVRTDQVESVRRVVARSERSRNKRLKVKYFKNANMLTIVPTRSQAVEHSSSGRVALLAAGTSDMAALNEAEVLLNLFGCETIRFDDVGVAAIQRLSTPMKKIYEFDPDAIIVAAGMEGALPSVVAGMSSVPVIGLPTSVGYGYGRGGEAALMSMLQACPLGICVVNIDAGVAAGVIAWLISKRASRSPSK